MNQKRTTLLLLTAIAVVALALVLFNRAEGDLSNKPLANFAIEDTAAIDRIFIVDTDRNAILLRRDPNSRYWDLNDSLKARWDAVELILKTIKRIKVKSPVPMEARENVIRLLAGAGKKVEIYQGGDKPVKTYIVGNATQDHTGTYMLLETAEEGRSSEPFIVHMEGFTGFLSTRFFTDVNEWRYTGVFDYPKLEFNRVEAIHHTNPQHSFAVSYNGGNELALFDGNGVPAPEFDTLAVKDFLLLFKKAHIETYKSYLTPQQEDSLGRTVPQFTFRVKGNDGDVRELMLYRKPKVIDSYDEQGNIVPWDQARMYSQCFGEIGLAQLFVFGPMVSTTYGGLVRGEGPINPYP